MENNSERSKIIVIAIIITAAILIVKLFFLQIVDDKYKQIAKRNALFYQTQYPSRGLIYDRNGDLLVSNQTIYDIMVIPREMREIDTVELCKVLNINSEQIKQALIDVKKKNKGIASYQQTPFIKRVSAEVYATFQEKSYKFPGFYTQARTARKYAIKSAGNLLGYINEVDRNDIKREPYYQQGDYIGKSGIEAAYEKVLRGRKGVSIYTRDVRNRIQDHYKNGAEDSMAIAGLDIVSTIDSTLQTYGEQLLKNKIGCIVAIEPSTGEILALISSPSFDPNLLTGTDRATNYMALLHDKYHPMFNRAIMSAYPPGSTFKIANALIGLQEGVLTPGTQYSCTAGYHVGRGVKCHNHFSPVNMTQSISVSCNAYYCHVFRNIVDNPKYENIEQGFTAWLQYLWSMGFGHKLGSDMYGEKGGGLPSPRTYDRIHGKGKWKSLSIISLAIGQGEIGTTPLQIANFMATIANRGYFYTPHIVKKIGDSDTISSAFTEKHYTLVSTDNYKKVIDGMYGAVNNAPGATATRAYVKGLDICGKTGTAQNPHGKDHAVFACFAPRENPKIAVAAYVENAGGSGGTWAAPIASLIVEKYLTDTITRPWLEEQMINQSFVNLQQP